MSRRSTSVKMRRCNGVLFRVTEDGAEKRVTVKPPKGRRTEAQINEAAQHDPDAQPLRESDLKRMQQVPRVKTMRRALGLTQEEFSARYLIPLGTLRDWEQGRTEPDQPARAYLRIIAIDPESVRRLLHAPRVIRAA